MLVDDRVEGTPHPRRDGRVHEAQHDDARERCEARPDTEHHRQTNAEQAQHEHPVGHRYGEGLEEGGQGLAGGGTRQVALRGRSAVDPRARRTRGIVQAEGLVQEGPQEHEADREAQQAKDEAERIVSVAKAEADAKVQQEEIVKQANAAAEDIKANALRYQEETKTAADDYALQVKQDSLQYAEDMLAYLSGNLSSALKGLEENKVNVENEMKNLKLPAVAEEAPVQEAPEEE